MIVLPFAQKLEDFYNILKNVDYAIDNFPCLCYIREYQLLDKSTGDAPRDYHINNRIITKATVISLSIIDGFKEFISKKYRDTERLEALIKVKEIIEFIGSIKSKHTLQLNHSRRGNYAAIKDTEVERYKFLLIENFIGMLDEVSANLYDCSYYLTPKKNEGLIDEPTKKIKLTLREIALFCFYCKHQITRQNGDNIAKIYGYKSGDKLYQYYVYYSSNLNRMNAEGSDKKNSNKKRIFENVIKALEKDKPAQKWANDEMKTFLSKTGL